MSSVDLISNVLSALKNAQLRKKIYTKVPYSKVIERILQIMKDEGYIEGHQQEVCEKGFKKINVKLKYYKGQPVIKMLTRVSKPGRRVYSSKKIAEIYNGLGISLLSTNKGIISNKDAAKLEVGGEVICTIY